ncbi:hypothetical protein KA005_67460 [bacterium]|nr:hypothetical protein [bacterium]
MKTIAFITRVKPRRFRMLITCTNSIKKQTSNDYVHIIFRDDKTKTGYGMLLANQSLAKVSPIDAQHVMVIDDDDMIIDSNFVKIFKKVIDNNNPEIVFFKGIVFGREIPPVSLWEKRPTCNQISGSCFTVRIDVWEKYVHKYAKKRCGDYSFISECYKNTKNHFWLDRVIVRTQKGLGKGRGEHEHA